MYEDTPVWPLSLRLIHWLSAALVLGALGYGVYMVQAAQNAAQRFELTQFHKSIGLAVLVITIARLWLRILTAAPRPERTIPLLRIAARAAHVGLYVLLLVLPLSGWLMATTTPVRVPTLVFGLFELPYPLAPALPTYRIARAIHVTAAIALASLIALHVAAALLHALFRRDRTFARMWREQPSPMTHLTPTG
jgi:cytochrome b561